MNESSLAVLHQSARPALAAGSRECSQRILRQVTNRYTRRLSAVTGMRLTPRLAIRGGVSMLWLSLCLLFAECLPLAALFTVLFAITSRPLWK